MNSLFWLACVTVYFLGYIARGKEVLSRKTEPQPPFGQAESQFTPSEGQNTVLQKVFMQVLANSYTPNALGKFRDILKRSSILNKSRGPFASVLRIWNQIEAAIEPFLNYPADPVPLETSSSFRKADKEPLSYKDRKNRKEPIGMSFDNIHRYMQSYREFGGSIGDMKQPGGHRCCLPSVFTDTSHSRVEFLGDYLNGVAYVTLKTAVDTKRSKVFFNMTFVVQGEENEPFSARALFDTKQGLVYLVLPDYDTCFAASYYDLPIDMCLSDELKYDTSFLLAAGESFPGILADMYKDEVQYLDEYNDTLIYTATRGDCSPLTSQEFLIGPDIAARVDVVFVNFTLGVQDPSVFNVPPKCQSLNEAASEKLLRKEEFTD